MLTGDLVRADCRKGSIRPRYVNASEPAHQERAQELVALFAAAKGGTYGELQDGLADMFGDSTQIMLYRGLVKLLLDRSTFEMQAAADPTEVRRLLFTYAVDHGPIARGEATHGLGSTRASAIAAVAEQLSVTPEEVEEALLADLRDNQRMTAFDPIEPDALLSRYNTALAQAVLLRATELTLTIRGQTPRRYRALFRAIKFHQLIHRVQRDGDEGYRITLDGPLSLFRLSNKYGLKMALFLPSLLLVEEGWELRADVSWPTHARSLAFQLSPADGLQSHLRDRGVWVSDEERWFIERFAEVDTPWSLSDEPEILDLPGGEVVIPDYAFEHPDGRKAWLEIIWFWRKGSLAPRLKALAGHAPPGLVLAVSDRLRASEDDLAQTPVPIHRFKGVLLPKPLLKLVEEAAARPGGGIRKRTVRRRKAKG